jgi:hypothetical protein
MNRVLLLLLGTLGIMTSLSPRAGGQTALPRVEGAEWAPVRARCQRLLEALRGMEVRDNKLPPSVEQSLAALLREDVKNERDADRALERLQALLDPLCLVGVNINPQSRVKAARGAAAADLVRGRPRLVLVKVANDAGITPALEVDGDELRTPGRKGEGRWLEAVVWRKAPLGRTLSGSRLEYVPLLLTAHETGKREATLKFDAGQGTQDLGFRAEVPVLFRVSEPRR